MAKLRLYCGIILLAGFLCNTKADAQYHLKIFPVDKDSAFLQQKFAIQTNFKNKSTCLDYIYELPSLMQSKGYITASVDSIKADSSLATVHLYAGDPFKWAHINTKNVDHDVLANANWSEKTFSDKPLNYQQFQNSEQQLLNYLENNGYPFARIYLDSIQLNNDQLSAVLKIDKGPLYKIDSIRIIGTAKISVDFLEHYLNIPNGSIYHKDKLQTISKKIKELPYVEEQQPWNLTLLGTGSILNLYLKPKKSSQIDALVGFLPSSGDAATSTKLLVTGQATINLKNALGNGESIGLDWQQVQAKSPRLDISFLEPYLFKSPFGVNFAFDLFKKDSSYVNINAMLGVQYSASAIQTSTIFIQSLSTNLLNVDTLTIISTHQLPAEADVSTVSFGINYTLNTTNYRFNPLRGNEFDFTGSIGTKKIKKNNQIVKLIDPSDSGFSFNALYDTVKLNSYQFKLKLAAAHYFQLGRASTLKLGVNGGAFQSPHSFLNELFQIGGYKLLRGFDEESIYASQYAVGTLEYRYLIGQNSFLFAFVDEGWAKNAVPGYSLNHSYLGIGVGMAFETKAGIFNISYAVGKRDDENLNMRLAKIHLGYVNFF
ncbi:MAG: BamA/TamA family outer membrane protein [Bacteroidetes bacterium]|nr:BamA/TamA family outer membrane protein [Bacteroidota bacterium]